jgi:hypothetical protein
VFWKLQLVMTQILAACARMCRAFYSWQHALSDRLSLSQAAKA